jgi:hypothetical protein
MFKVERHIDKLLVWDAAGNSPLVLSREEAVDLAQKLLDMAGQIKEEVDSIEA